MRFRSVVLFAAILCLLPIAAVADISRISPQSVPFGAAEEFLTVFGTGLAGTESTFVVFDGPAGQFFIEPGNSLPPNPPDPNDPDPPPAGPPQFPDDKLIAFIPFEVVYTPGPYTITVVAKDVGQDARTIGIATLTVQAASTDGPPLISYTETVYEEARNSEGAFVNFDVSASDADGDVPVTCNHASGSQFPIGTTRVNCSATNNFGTSTAQILVIVDDATNPIVTVPGDITTTDTNPTFTASAADNIDGALPVTCSPASGSTFGPGVTLVICSATDSHNNTGVGTFTVTRPGGAPVVTVPADITVTSTDGFPVDVDYTATATNDGAVNCLPAGNTFPIGTTVITCTATNLTGSDAKSFRIHVLDGVLPELELPADITAEATSPSGATVSYVVTATNGGVVSCSPASGSTFPLGQNLVTCTATNAGGSDTGTFYVTVVDTTPPQILTVEASPNTLWPPNHNMANVSVTVVASDIADATPVSLIKSVKSNQPINGTGDGDTSPDWIVTGPLTVQLRAERSQGVDRTYTITVETVDDSGNSSTATTTVVVTQGRRRAVH